MRHYIYIDKEYADKEHMVNIFGVFDEPLKDVKSTIDKPYYLYIGQNIPHYITVEDGGTIREATNTERYKRGQYKLEKCEYFDGNEIQILKKGEYYDGEKVVSVNEPDIPIAKSWDFEKRKWVFSETELQAINRIEEELIECMSEIKTRKEIGLGFEVAEKKYKRLLEDHRVVSEIYATKRNEKI